MFDNHKFIKNEEIKIYLFIYLMSFLNIMIYALGHKHTHWQVVIVIFATFVCYMMDNSYIHLTSI